MIFGTALIGLTAILYRVAVQSQQASFDTLLYNHAVDIANATDLTILGDIMVDRNALIEEGKIFPFPLGQTLVQIRMLDGRLLLTSRALGRTRLPLSRESLQLALQQGYSLDTFQVEKTRYRMVNYLVRKPQMPPLALQVAVPLTFVDSEQRQLLSWIWLSIPLALVVAALAGLITASRALAPVSRIVRSARSIEPHELSARVPVPEESETKELALTLNDLLTKIQRAFESQEQFIADASHQLKTPLAIMRGEIDVALRKHAPDDEARSADETLLRSVSQEVDQLSRLVDNLLLLARFDSGAPNRPFSSVRVDEVLLETIAQLSRPARDKRVDLRFDIEPGGEEAPSFEAPGDTELLKILFFNLIENGIKYSPPDSSLDVQLASEPSVLRVEIRDRGPGIDTTDLSRIFDRFHRSGEEQHRIPGVGLGLSIAQKIAKVHGAEIEVSSSKGEGSVFIVRIKKF